MKRVCPGCHYIGKGRHKGSLLLSIANIGLAIIIFGMSFRYSLALSAFISLIPLCIAYIGIRNYYKVGGVCPKCNFKDMPSIDEPSGQEIIKKNGLSIEDTAIFICNNCDYKGLGYRTESAKWSLFLIPLGIIFFFSSFFYREPIIIIGALIIIGTGVYSIIASFMNKTKCPSCKNKSLVTINSEQSSSPSQIS